MAEEELDEHERTRRPPKRNHLISRKKFRDFIGGHPEAARDAATFAQWCKIVEQAVWVKFSDVKATFNTADVVGDRVVFNVGGNTYRVVARVQFSSGTVFIRHVLTPGEYDAGGWKSAP